MSFKIEKIQLYRFRSYRDVEVTFDPHLTILYGPNAIGKTNLIEALQLITEGVSFRNPVWTEVENQAFQDGFARISAFARDENRVREIVFEIKDGKKSLKVNGKAVRSLAHFSGVIPSVLFTPEDIALISDNSSYRRGELDSLGAKLSAKYSQITQEYRRILSQKNKLLKSDVFDNTLLDVLNFRLVEYGAALIQQRARLLARLSPLLVNAYEQINQQEKVSLGYQNNIVSKEPQPQSGKYALDELLQFTLSDIKELFAQELVRRRQDELVRRVSLVGPHRDDIHFYLDKSDARTFASQGQKRSLTLAWKMAEVNIIEDITTYKPLLLLDDVMSELDDHRRSSLTKLVGEVAQTIITTANIGYFTEDLLRQASVIDVESLISHDK